MAIRTVDGYTKITGEKVWVIVTDAISGKSSPVRVKVDNNTDEKSSYESFLAIDQKCEKLNAINQSCSIKKEKVCKSEIDSRKEESINNQ